MKLTSALILSAISIAGLAACGGSSNPNNQPPVLALLKFDSTNAIAAAGVASEAALESADIGGVTDFTDPTPTAEAGVDKSGPVFAATSLAQETLGASVSFIPVPATTSPCAVSGSVTVSGDLADLATFTAGDVITVDSDMCDDGTGQVVDGLLEMEITSFEGDILTSEFLFGVELALTDFMVTESNETTTANGNVGTTIDTRTPPIVEGSVFGDRFSVTGMGITETIINFSTIYTEDSSAFPVGWTTDSIGTVDSSEIAGAITYETMVEFEGSGEGYPYTGELLVTGADNSTLYLITIDDTNVQIDADYDGDGIIDETLNLTWVELEG